MARGRPIARTVAAALSAAGMLPWTAPAGAAPVKTTDEACIVAKARVSARGHFEVSDIAFCDPIGAGSNPKGYIVLALHGRRFDCGGDICGSTNMGWFAIEKASGQVFEWDMAQWRLGPLVARS